MLQVIDLPGHTLEVSSYEYYAKLSQETPAFAAVVKIDGVAYDVSNDGQGGCNRYMPVPDGTGNPPKGAFKKLQEIETLCQTLPDVEVDFGDGQPAAKLPPDLDLLLIARFENFDDAQRKLRKRSKKN